MARCNLPFRIAQLSLFLWNYYQDPTNNQNEYCGLPYTLFYLGQAVHQTELVILKTMTSNLLGRNHI